MTLLERELLKQIAFPLNGGGLLYLISFKQSNKVYIFPQMRTNYPLYKLGEVHPRTQTVCQTRNPRSNGSRDKVETSSQS